MFSCKKGIGKERKRRNQVIQIRLLIFFCMFLDLVIPGLPWCFRYWSLCFSGPAAVGSTVNSAAGTSGQNHCCSRHRAGGIGAAVSQVQSWCSHTAGLYTYCSTEGKRSVVPEAASSSSLDLSAQYCIPTAACVWRHPWDSWSIFDQTASLSWPGQTQQLWKWSEPRFK